MIDTETLAGISNATVYKSFLKASEVLGKHKKITVNVSGGADSDIMLDLVERCKAPHNEVRYIFINTGLEYRATLEHLDYLENRYGIKIERHRGTPIPVAVKETGVPFCSKHVSEMIHRLQERGFGWEGGTAEELNAKYPRVREGVHWYTETTHKQFTIGYNKHLREFLDENPPPFPISSYCCDISKKAPAHKAQEGSDLVCIGMRRAEGGVRAKIKSCYLTGSEIAKFLPVFWYAKADKEYYEGHFGIVHSRCYTEYGLKRTGCVGCPFNPNAEKELATVEKYEPQLVKACRNVFGKSYEYTRKYREFQKAKDQEARVEKTGQQELDIYGGTT